MLTVLYTFFIAPLEVLMTAVLGAAYDLIGSYGWAIVVMSLVVNTLILPIYNKAESWQEEERRIKKGFEATEAMIKRTFKGQERFAMLTTMRRQHGYSARLALRSSLGFFLQIPFFIAAFHLLSNMPELKGVAFGPITDLGAADGLLVLGGFSINVLPLVMTAVNLLSAFVYTATLSRQDKIQLYGLSALFLVLLYVSPAALTLYWTLNNVYSLGKNIVEKSLLPAWRRKREGRPASVLQTSEQPRGFAWVLGGGLLILLYAVWDTNKLWKGTIGLGGIPDAGRLEAFLMMLALSTSLISEGLRRIPASDRWVLVGRAGNALTLINVLYSALLCTGLGGFMADWYAFPKDPPGAVWIGAAFSVLSLVLGLLSFIADKLLAIFVRFYREGMRAATVALLVLGIAVMLVGLPALVLTSDPDSVSTTFDVVMPLFVLAMLFAGILAAILCRGLPKGAAVAAFATALFLDLALAAYAFLLVGDYGLINGGELEKTQPLYDAMNVWKDAAAIAVLALLSVFAVKKLSMRTVRDFSTLLTVLVFGLSVMMLVPLTERIAVKSAVPSTKPVPPASSKDLYTFSATGKNLLVVVFDMYTADHFQKILEERPELKGAFKGFTWYSDTTAAGSGTVYALPVTAGGNRYSIHQINQNNEGKSIEQLYGESYGLIPRLLGSDWDSAVVGSLWQESNSDYVNISHDDLMSGWFDYYYRDVFSDYEEKDRGEAFVSLLGISIFKAAPYSLRKLVYNKGQWLQEDLESLRGYKAFAVVKSWRDFSRVVPEGNIYRYVYSDGSHSGRYVSEDGEPSLRQTETPREWRRDNRIINYSHYLSERAITQKFAEWLLWMQENDVYDNTRIVVTSDHGGRDSVKLYQTLGLVPYKGSLEDGTSTPGLRYPILLMKDFDSRGVLKTSEEPMTNGDVPDLILKDIADIPEPYKGTVGQENRLRYYDSCDKTDLSRGEMPCYTYKVQGSMFKRESWSLVK